MATQARISPTGVLVEPLSPCELEVLQLISSGSTNLEIARMLIVSPGTVKAHTASIYRKLDVANRTEAPPLWPGSRHPLRNTLKSPSI